MNEKIDRILSIAAQNGVSLHKNFTKTYLSTHGFYEGPQQLAQSTLDEMERLCFKGMNAGFDGNLKGALDKLSGIVISLTAVKNGDLRELSKLDAQRAKILDGANKTNYALRDDMRDTVREYISSSVDAIDTIISLNSEGEIFSQLDEKQIKYMQESKKKFAELSIILTKIMDVGSLKAKENAEKIIENIKIWRRDCARYICTSGSMLKLDNAIEIAREWNNQITAPNKKEKIKDVPQYDRDELTIIATSRTGLETLSVFNARINTQLAEIDKLRDEINANKAKVSELRAELAGMDKKKKDIALEFKNTGDAVKANAQIALLRQREDEIKSEIKGLDGNGRLSKRDNDLKNQRETVTNIKYICDTLGDYKNDLVSLSRMISQVDFAALVGAMTGRFSDLEKASQTVMQVKLKIEAIRQAFKESADRFSEEEEIYNQTFNEEISIEEEQSNVIYDENGLDPELAALLGDFEENKTQEKEETKTELKKIVPLGDDDK